MDSLLHDPREWDHDAVEGLWDAEYLAAKYDRILKHYGFTASRTEGRGMLDDEEEEAVGSTGGGGNKRRLAREEVREEGLPISSSAPRAFELETGGGAGEGRKRSSSSSSSSSSVVGAGSSSTA